MKNNFLEKVKVDLKDISDCQKEIFFTVSAGLFENFLKEEKKELVKNLKMDGFRPGRVPEVLLEKKIGAEKILYGAAERAIKEVYPHYILKKKIEVIGEPKIEVTKIGKGSNLEFKALVEVLPSFQMFDGWKEEIKNFNRFFRQKNQSKIKVEESEVDRELDFLAKQRAKLITVSRSARKGDQLEIDIRIEKDKVPLENGTAKKQPIILGEGSFLPEFEKNLLGRKAGEEINFSLKMPADYHLKQLANQEVDFFVKINLVQERQIPEINDQFASSIGKFENLNQLKENLRKGIQQEKNYQMNQEQEREIIKKLAKKINITLPLILIEKELARMMLELEQDIKKLGLDKISYLNQIKKSEEELKNEWKKEWAPLRVKSALILKQIAKEENIEVSSQEIETRMNQVLQYYSTIKQAQEQLDLQFLYERIKGELINEKVFTFLKGL